ncbi:MAG TPA: chemotaxis protein CheW [Sphingorhabdus sp.]|jgi:purine-binding chemotaxis protein CheW|nr:chemotaxis protein CheW [Sphingorhabdus sp.]
MNALYLVAHIDGCRVAIESDRVESIVHVPDIIAVPRSDPSISGLFALRSRVLTLIDSQYVVTGKQRRLEKGCLAVVAEIGGHHYGLAVDRVEDVVSISAEDIETAINPAAHWKPIISETASVGGELVMILDPAKLVAGEQALAA